MELFYKKKFSNVSTDEFLKIQKFTRLVKIKLNMLCNNNSHTIIRERIRMNMTDKLLQYDTIPNIKINGYYTYEQYHNILNSTDNIFNTHEFWENYISKKTEYNIKDSIIRSTEYQERKKKLNEIDAFDNKTIIETDKMEQIENIFTALQIDYMDLIKNNKVYNIE